MFLLLHKWLSAVSCCHQRASVEANFEHSFALYDFSFILNDINIIIDISYLVGPRFKSYLLSCLADWWLNKSDKSVKKYHKKVPKYLTITYTHHDHAKICSCGIFNQLLSHTIESIFRWFTFGYGYYYNDATSPVGLW